MKIRLADLASQLNLEFEGDGELLLEGVCSLEEARSNCIGFAEAAKIRMPAVAPAALICLAEAQPDCPYIKSKKPRYDFARAAAIFHPSPAPRAGIHPSAYCAPGCVVEEGAEIGAYCCLESGSRVGSGTILQPHVRIGANSVVGSNCRIYAGVSIGSDCKIGDSTTLDVHVRVTSGSSIGPQSYVGCNTVIDGAQLGTNVIIDNMSSISSGSQLGDHAIVISKTFIGRNVKMGQYSLVAALSVVMDNVELGPFVQVAGYSVVDRSFPEPKLQLAGQPARDIKAEIRERALASSANKILSQRLAARNEG